MQFLFQQDRTRSSVHICPTELTQYIHTYTQSQDAQVLLKERSRASVATEFHCVHDGGSPGSSLHSCPCLALAGLTQAFYFFLPGYTPGTPYKVSCSPTSGAVPPYSSSPNPYQTAVYPVRSAYPQQSPYAQVCLGMPYTLGRVGSVISLQPWDSLAVVSVFPAARHVLYTASVCSTPSRHSPHHGGAAQWHASNCLPCSHPSS